MPPKFAAHRLKRYREEAGYSQRAAASIIGVTPTQLMEWEKGRRMPTARYLLKLSVLYQRLVTDLYYEEHRSAIREIQERKEKYEAGKNGRAKNRSP